MMKIPINENKKAFHSGFVLLLLLFLPIWGGCLPTAGQRPSPVEESRNYYWPMPPEQPRFMWETVLRTPGDVEINQKKDVNLLKMIADDSSSSSRRVFQKPVRVAAFKGRIFVSDSMAGVIHVFDAVRRRYFQFGGRFEGKLLQPLGVAVDRAGQVYVVDSQQKVIMVYDPLGLWLRTLGKQSGMVRPGGIAVSPAGDRIYVTDRDPKDGAHHALWIFDAEGGVIHKIAKRGSGDGELSYPADVAVGPDGRVFVLDSGNFRVQVFDRDGKFLAKWGQVGQALGQFSRPRALTVDRHGRVYVVDGSFVNIQVFTDDGTLLLPFGERGQEDGPGLFSSPAGIASDETDRLYIVDQWFGKIEVFRILSEPEGAAILTGQPLSTFRPKP
ncbi:MAG: 6-bladed beta-propeller [Magnetococcales bacterium]|nr:6-bladed beta-propeller [Magnetococcales bacterium]